MICLLWPLFHLALFMDFCNLSKKSFQTNLTFPLQHVLFQVVSSSLTFHLLSTSPLRLWQLPHNPLIISDCFNLCSDIGEGLPNNPLLKCTLCAQRLEDTHFVQVSHFSTNKVKVELGCVYDHLKLVCHNLFSFSSAQLLPITNFASHAQLSPSRSRGLIMRFSAQAGSAAL